MRTGDCQYTMDVNLTVQGVSVALLAAWSGFLFESFK